MITCGACFDSRQVVLGLLPHATGAARRLGMTRTMRAVRARLVVVAAAALLCAACQCVAEHHNHTHNAKHPDRPAGGAHRKLLFDRNAVPVLIMSIFNAFARFYYAEALAGLQQLLRALFGSL